MFSILFRDTAKSLRNLLKTKCNPCNPSAVIAFDYSTFTTRDFLYENSDETGTLLTRFVKYLAMENSKLEPIVPTTIRYPDFFPVTDIHSFQRELKKIDVAQIPNLIIFSFTYKSNGDPLKFVKVINDVDDFCADNLDKMDFDTVLRTLYAFMFLLPNKITKTGFYNDALNKLVNEFEKECPKEKFVKVCFYLGLGKKNPVSVKLLKQFLHTRLSQYLPELTAMDLSIVGNAAFKASVPIGNEEFINKVKSEIFAMDSVPDDAILVNLLKILRYHRTKNNEICEKLDVICNEKELSAFQIPGITHVFAYFAECMWNNKKTCSKFVNETLKRIRASPEEVRAKDLSTFLWCCAQLQQGDLLQENDFRFIDQVISEKINQDEYMNFSDQLIDTGLSLWMMGHQSRVLIAEITSLRLNPTSKNPDRAKLDTRFKVLISCIAIEKPDWLTKNKKQVFVEALAAPDYLVKNRSGLNTAFDKLKAEGVNAKIVTPIEGINVAGILAELSDGHKCYVEVLEDEQTMKFNKVPAAIVQLKMRLLKQIGYNVVLVRADELNGLSSLTDLISSSEETKLKKNVAV